MNESYCKKHKRSYTFYCKICDILFCDFCESHNHPTQSLFYVLKREQFEADFFRVEKINDTVNSSLNKIKALTDSLHIYSSKKETEIIQSYESLTFKLNEEKVNGLRKLESEVKEQMESLGEIANKCLGIRGLFDRFKVKLGDLKKRTEEMFDENPTKAYFGIMEYRDMDTETLIKHYEHDIKLLENQLKNINLQEKIINDVDSYTTHKGVLTKVTEEFTTLHNDIEKLKNNSYEYIMTIKSYFNEKLNELKAHLNKKSVVEVNKHIEEDRTTNSSLLLPEELKEPSFNTQRDMLISIKSMNEAIEEQELSNFKTMLETLRLKGTKEISRRLIKLKEGLEEVIKQRMNELGKVQEGIRVATEQEETLRNLITDKISEVDELVSSLVDGKALSDITEDVDKRKRVSQNLRKNSEVIESIYTELNNSLLEYKMELKATEDILVMIKQFNEQANNKKAELENINKYLGVMEATKDELVERLNTIKLENTSILKNLITTKVNIERQISNRRNEINEVRERVLEMQKNFDKKISINRLKLETFEKSLEDQVNSRRSLRNVYPQCTEGNIGRVKLQCDHYICLFCANKNRSRLTDIKDRLHMELTASNVEERKVSCKACGGILQSLSTVLVYYRIDYT